ncbi:MAG: triose-phosphate isomerase [Candidatus Doudnabacteria bacterium]
MKKLIIANWKMNPQTIEETRRLAASLEHRLHTTTADAEVAICAPFVYLPALLHYTHRVFMGAQNMSWADKGALTGEISAVQLKLWNVNYVILGHSERRLFLGETDSVVNAKIIAALKHKITPIVCLGGEEGAIKAEMKNLVTKQFIKTTKDLDKKQLEKIVFVYEPVWAISSMKKSEPATGEHAHELVRHIFQLLEHRIGKVSLNVRVLYGGTVNQANVHEYAKYPIIGGALVGAASLDAENFWKIVQEFGREAIHRT